MIKLIRCALQQIINDIDAGNSNISENQQQEILDLLQKLNSEELSKLEAAEYLGISRATFDNYVKKGILPKGKKRIGFKELSWLKSDLNKCKL